MSDHPRFTVNRSVCLLVPEQPFLDWVKAVDPEPVPTLTLEAIRDDASVFLLPEVADTPENALRWVEKRWRTFFEFMLGEWFDDSLWPQQISLEMFRQWFTLVFTRWCGTWRRTRRSNSKTGMTRTTRYRRCCTESLRDCATVR
jgi:hypothetical protein